MYYIVASISHISFYTPLVSQKIVKGQQPSSWPPSPSPHPSPARRPPWPWHISPVQFSKSPRPQPFGGAFLFGEFSLGEVFGVFDTNDEVKIKENIY